MAELCARSRDAEQADGIGDPAHHDRSELLDLESRQRVARRGRCVGRCEQLAGACDVHDPGGEVHVVADEIVAAPGGASPVHPHADPQRCRFTGRSREPLEQVEARGEAGRRVGEPEHQTVTELLHDASAVRQCRTHETFLEIEEHDGFRVAARRRELGEPDDVGEDDRARFARSRRRQASVTVIPPLRVVTRIAPSVPSGQSQRTEPLRACSSVAGCIPGGTVTVTEPECASTSTEPARPTRRAPLPDLQRHSAAHSSTSMLPEPVRASTVEACSIEMLPLPLVTLVSPSPPRSETVPEPVPTKTSVPVGQRTFIAPDLPAISTPSGPEVTRSAPRSTSTSSRSSPVTSTEPDRQLTRSGVVSSMGTVVRVVMSPSWGAAAVRRP